MSLFLTILLGLAMATVLVVLLTGVTLLARGGEANRRWSNRLMRMRVVAQTVVLILLGLLALTKLHGS